MDICTRQHECKWHQHIITGEISESSEPSEISKCVGVLSCVSVLACVSVVSCAVYFAQNSVADSHGELQRHFKAIENVLKI